MSVDLRIPLRTHCPWPRCYHPVARHGQQLRGGGDHSRWGCCFGGVVSASVGQCRRGSSLSVGDAACGTSRDARVVQTDSGAYAGQRRPWHGLPLPTRVRLAIYLIGPGGLVGGHPQGTALGIQELGAFALAARPRCWLLAEQRRARLTERQALLEPPGRQDCGGSEGTVADAANFQQMFFVQALAATRAAVDDRRRFRPVVVLVCSVGFVVACVDEAATLYDV